MIKKYGLFIIIIIFSFLLLIRLNNNKILFTDELIIEDVSYGISKGQNLLIPYINGQPDLAKPPFVYWIASIPYLFIKPYPYVRRITMIIWGIFSIITIYKLHKIKNKKGNPLLSAFVYAFSLPTLFFINAANFDIPNAFFILLTVYIYNKEVVVGKNIKILPFLITAGFLTRSFLYLLGLSGIIIDFFLFEIKSFKLKYFIKLLLFSIIPVTLWLLYAYVKEPDALLNQFLILPVKHHGFGMLRGEEATGYFYYLLLFLIFPLGIPVITKLIKYKFINKQYFTNRIDKQIMITIFIYILVLSLSQTRHIWYVIPVIPFLSIIASNTIYEIYNIKLYPLKILGLVMVAVFLTAPSLMLVFNLFPEADIITANKYIENNLAYVDTIYLWNYSYLPKTRFYPKDSVIVINKEDIFLPSEKNKSVLIIKGDEIDQLKNSYQILNIVGKFKILRLL